MDESPADAVQWVRYSECDQCMVGRLFRPPRAGCDGTQAAQTQPALRLAVLRLDTSARFAASLPEQVASREVQGTLHAAAADLARRCQDVQAVQQLLGSHRGAAFLSDAQGPGLPALRHTSPATAGAAFSADASRQGGDSGVGFKMRCSMLLPSWDAGSGREADACQLLVSVRLCSSNTGAASAGLPAVPAGQLGSSPLQLGSAAWQLLLRWVPDDGRLPCTSASASASSLLGAHGAAAGHTPAALLAPHHGPVAAAVAVSGQGRGLGPGGVGGVESSVLVHIPGLSGLGRGHSRALPCGGWLQALLWRPLAADLADPGHR